MYKQKVLKMNEGWSAASASRSTVKGKMALILLDFHAQICLSSSFSYLKKAMLPFLHSSCISGRNHLRMANTFCEKSSETKNIRSIQTILVLQDSFLQFVVLKHRIVLGPTRWIFPARFTLSMVNFHWSICLVSRIIYP